VQNQPETTKAASTTAREAETIKWRQAAAEKRIKTQKLRGRAAVKVWITPEERSTKP
jgi:hypothetical protein